MMILLFSVLNDEQRALVERIFHEHHIHFQRISFNIVKSEEAAEDVVSTAFIKIMDNIEKISDLPCPQMTAFCVVSIMKLSLLAMNFQNRKEVVMFDTLHLTNMLRLEVESIPETGLPLDAFPYFGNSTGCPVQLCRSV